MMKTWQLLILGFAAFAVPSIVSAQSLGLNFAATDPDAATSSLNPGDVAGVVPQANWNNLTANTGTNPSGLVLSNGLPSSVTVSWTSPNTWRAGANNAFPAGPNRVLTSGYLDTDDVPVNLPASITVNNIDAAVRTPAYDVYVYFVSDDGGNRGGGYTLSNGVTSVVKYGSTMASPSTFIEDPGTDVDNSLDGTYLRFRRFEGASITVTGDSSLTTPNGFRAPINAIQLVARPRAGDVNADGSVDINDFHIIRGNLFKTGQTDEQGDIAGSGGIVDFEDYREWKRLASPAAVAASLEFLGNVPEPGSAVLLAMGAALAAFATRRSARRLRHAL
jgi:hypothetical protein